MRPWEYYQDCGVEYPDIWAKREEMRTLIDNTPMTAKARNEAHEKVITESRKWFQEARKPYDLARQQKEREFWIDARAELRYHEGRNPSQVSVIESIAYSRGHSGGYSEVYNALLQVIEDFDAYDAATRKG